MAIIKWTPMDRLFDEFFNDSFLPAVPSRAFTPAMDVYEDRDDLVVETPLAGVDPSKVSVQIEDNVLTVSGSSAHTSEVDEKSYYRKEVRSGSFYRAVALPKAVKGDAAKATFDKGILTIRIPKAEEAKPKKIAIQAKNG